MLQRWMLTLFAKLYRLLDSITINVEQSAYPYVSILYDLIQTSVNYVVQEVIAVIRDTFRKYPHKYESVSVTLCKNLDSLDE